jgi:hypothetical protein
MAGGPVLYTEVLYRIRMSGLLAHALEQQVSLPVARLLVLVQTASQLFQLVSGRGLEDGRKRLGERFSGLPGKGSRLPREDLPRHLVDGLLCSNRLPSPSVLLTAS